MSRFITLYSGSSGNSGVVEQDGRFLLIDMGGSCRATINALHAVGLTPENMQGILITHEHSDHIKGLKVFLKKHNVPIYSRRGTLTRLSCTEAVPEHAELIELDESPCTIGDFEVHRFDTSHDAVSSCGFSIKTATGDTMAIATDLGMMTGEVLGHLSRARFVALEANYDRELLRMGRYPYYLKKRIESEKGHLSNTDSAATVAALIAGGCRQLAMCHLSSENNHPALVTQAIDAALFEAGMKMPEDCSVQIARRHEPGEWIDFSGM